MRTGFLATTLLLPLLGGCMGDDPLVPELKGRWAAPNASKIRYALMAERLDAAGVGQGRSQLPGSVRHVRQMRHPAPYGPEDVSAVMRDVKRDGSRLILSGNAPVPGASEAKIELLLQNGEVRFDDIIDERGRSIRYDRFAARRRAASG